MVELENLSLNLGEFELEKFNLRIKNGEYYVLLGPSGVGKTVLLEAIAGFHRLREGRVMINGNDVTFLPPEERGVVFVPQNLGIFPHLNVEENILFGAKARKMNMRHEASEMHRISEIMGITGILKRYPRELSGGEKQRVALARALIVKPELLLLDEPLSSLDQLVRTQLQYFIKNLHADMKFTALHVTHDFSEAFLLGDVVSVLLNGNIQQTGKRNEIYFHPRTRDVAEFLCFRNIFTGEVIRREESCLVIRTSGIGEIIVDRTFRNENIRTGENVFWGVRAEEVRILRSDIRKEERKDNPIEGRIENVFEKAFSHTLIFRVKDSDSIFEIEIPHAAFRKLEIKPGMSVLITLARERIWVAKE